MLSKRWSRTSFPFVLFITSAASALAPAPTFGHHSRAPYDLTGEIVIEGTVAKLDWRNPHILMTVDTRGSDGQTVQQEIEVWAVSEARALGLPREVISPGARVRVRAHPGRRGPGARALGLDVRTDDGATYPLNTDAQLAIAPRVSTEAQGLAGRWVPTLESYNEFQLVVPSWQFTEAGRVARAERARIMAVPGIALLGICEPFPPPTLMVFPDLRTIEVGDASVTMRFEAQGNNLERTVHLDHATHPPGLAPSLMGHSIGRWEEETLVIDTVGIAPHLLGWSPRARLIERLRLANDRLNLEYTLTVDDPVYLVEPGSYTATWNHRPDLEPADEACDPETARRALEEPAARSQ